MFIRFAWIVPFIFFGCAHTQKQQPVVQKKVFENQELKAYKKINKLEATLFDLKMQNDILMQALKDQKAQTKQPAGKYGHTFPQFDELVFDQARKAFETKDVPRLKEAVKILTSNQPQSNNLDAIYHWLIQLQFEGEQYNSALYSANNFLKLKPKSTLVPNMVYMKGQIYEKMNLKGLAVQMYTNVKDLYPGHVMAGMALDRIRKMGSGEVR